ncbi:hypothetical protein [Nocardioides seonyuensis]|uniref:hypothetical protein n=1 Tax=Nocardioides seonyuensis TaxID=2518371 RepID=UPI0014202856|nr:hypothetical protein [Nocardioides seonyuensis]
MASVLLVVAASPGQAAGFDQDSWISTGWVVDTGITNRKAARLEKLPDGRLMALVVVGDNGTYGHAGSSVLVSRIRTDDTWGAPQVVDLATGNVDGRTFDTYADPAGRVLAVWAEASLTPGQWPVRSVSRDASGTWGTPGLVYTARTNGALSTALQVGHVRPRLVAGGGQVTVAWADLQGHTSATMDLDAESPSPFHARRWAAGSWGPILDSDAYGPESALVSPQSPQFRLVQGDPVQASRDSDGRISFLFTLEKRRPVHTMEHALNPPGAAGSPNVDDVWDGVPERPWDAASETAWVVHLDPGDATWGDPAPLISSGGPLVNCASPDLPANPPEDPYFQEWLDFSESPGISTSCPVSQSWDPSGSYTQAGELRIHLSYRRSPTARVVLNQSLSRPCNQPPSSYTFCFDDWGTPDWAVDWRQVNGVPGSGARIAIPAGAGRPGPDAVVEGRWPLSRSHTVTTSAGQVVVTDRQGADGRSIVLDRASGTDVTWTDAGITTGNVSVSGVFAHGHDVAVFYDNGAGGNYPDEAPRCGMLVLRGGADVVVGPLQGCLLPNETHRQDVVQLDDGRLARIDATQAGSAVRLFGSDQPTDPTPTEPSPSEPSPSEPTPTDTGSPAPQPAPPPPAPPSPQPPAPTSMTLLTKPKVTGKLKVGKVLRANAGTWQPAATSVSYQWLLGKKQIARATKAKLKLKKAWKGKRVAVRVTVSAGGAVPRTVTVKAEGRVR